MNTIRYHTEQGVVHGLLLNEGRKFLTLIVIEHPVRLRKVLKTEGRYIRNLDEYPVTKVLRTLHRMIKADYGSMRKAPKSVLAIF